MQNNLKADLKKFTQDAYKSNLFLLIKLKILEVNSFAVSFTVRGLKNLINISDYITDEPGEQMHFKINEKEMCEKASLGH